MSGKRMFGDVELPPAAFPGFEHVRRFWDPVEGKIVAKILPGEFYVTNSNDEVISTVLGSCVAACVWDPVAKVGGMNHFMLAGSGGRASDPNYDPAEDPLDSARYGVFAMEFLINGVLAGGGRRDRLLVKLAGGGNVIESMATVGSNNVRFAHRYLADEGLRLVAEHVEGSQARRLVFHPVTGRTRVLTLAAVEPEIVETERQYRSSLTQRVEPGDVQLF